jgi:XTP/dITP diphosphohydrolase
MKELLVATTNPAKLAEYQLLLRNFDLKVISLREAGIEQAAPEDAASFAENARLKARFYFDLARIPTLADDGGLEVDALDGAPGVRSHRWLGAANPDDRMLAEAVIRRMIGVAPEQRTARIHAAATLVWLEGGVRREALAEAALEGIVAKDCYREVRAGFPYRSVLWLPQRGCYLAELTEDEAAQLSQRRAVIEQLSTELTSIAGTSD